MKTKFIFLTFVILVWFMPKVSFASQFFFETPFSLYSFQDNVTVNVFLDTQDATVNTVSGDIYLGNLKQNDIDIKDGNSSILFWIDKPVFESAENKISFSGITPGGLQGSKIFLFSVVVKNNTPGQNISFVSRNGSVLLHDGTGTLVKTPLISKNIFISLDENFNPVTQTRADKEQPEDFTPVVVQDINLYEGKNTLVFATQDKNSGIAGYKIKEGYFGSYIDAESPYVLKDQKLFKVIFVKAIDNAGNERLAVIHPQKKIINENFILIFSILLVSISIIIYIKRRR